MEEGLLYPAYQKYYAALRCLEAFGVESDFFDNVASLDGFFSEYRSVTLVLQKSLAHTPYKAVYDRFPKGAWDSFFNEQRVKAFHEHPVEFTKTVSVDLYYPDRSVNVVKKSYSIGNDLPLSELVHSMKEVMGQFGGTEVYFSARFSFTEKDGGEDVWGKIIEGLLTMKGFMDYMYAEIGEECPLCEELRSKIDKVDPIHRPSDFLSTVDYVYYPRTGEFERAGRVAATFGDGRTPRSPLGDFCKSVPALAGLPPFERFVRINLAIASSELMPVILRVYDDDTFDFDMFASGIKTTYYRKINEVASEILDGGIRQVYLMAIYIAIDCDDVDVIKMTASERAEAAGGEYLTFCSVGADLAAIEYCFDLRRVRDPRYIASKLQGDAAKEPTMTALNIKPILNAFNAVRVGR